MIDVHELLQQWNLYRKSKTVPLRKRFLNHNTNLHYLSRATNLWRGTEMHCFSPGETTIIHTTSFEPLIGLCVSEYVSGIATAIVSSHKKIRENILSFLSIYFLSTKYQENGVPKKLHLSCQKKINFYICFTSLTAIVS